MPQYGGPMDRSVINFSSGIQLCLDQLSNKAKSQFPLPQVQLSASVNRSRSPGRSPLPTLAGPTFSAEPAHHDDHIREGHPEVDHPSAPLGTPHKLLVGVVPGIRALHNPPQTGPKRNLLTLLGDLAEQATNRQFLAGGGRVVGAIQMNPCPFWQLSERSQGVKGLTQKRRVVAVRWSSDGSERDAPPVHDRGALETSFAPVHRAPTRFLPSARGLGDAAVHRQIGQLRADETVIGIEGDVPEALSITPSSIHSLRLRRNVLSEQDASAIFS